MSKAARPPRHRARVADTIVPATLLKRFSPVSPRAALVSILLLALVLRLIFFVGLVSGDPQDDGVYYGNAFAIYHNGPTYLEQFRDRRPGELANPIAQFHLRPLVTYPIAASFVLFSAGEIAASLWSLLCSLGVVLVVYRLGRALHDEMTGRLAAFLCAWYPLEIINATRILSDVQVGLFFGLALLLVFEAARRQSSWLYVLAGVSAAAAYLANARGLIALGIVTACAALQAVQRKVSWRAPALVVAGFTAIFAVEAAIYFAHTGDPLLNYRIHSEAARFKYLHEPVETIRLPGVQVRYTNGEPLELTRTAFVMRDLPTAQFGLFFYLFAAGVAFSLWRRRNRLMVLVSIAIFAFLEFGAVAIAYDRVAGELQYSMIYKQPRFLLILTAPLMVIAADALRALWRRTRLATIVVVAVLLLTAVTSTIRTRAFYRGGLHDLRSVVSFVRGHPDVFFWSDSWAVEQLQIFANYAVPGFRILVPSTRLEDVRGSCVIVGGSRGVELLASYVESTYPAFIRRVLETGVAPPDWRIVQEVRGRSTFQRARDLRIYCVP
jgi:4-amino-4-deoxy-L-arabinose transferase-like glycosyltransferase